MTAEEGATSGIRRCSLTLKPLRHGSKCTRDIGRC
ncbi:unnamed protein product [Chondrus crispus]|uniref:Uncharacterized protein n=1 Tax=Chondrus crispus TaxID=2769 RepID=R7QIC3_CHOCR|nr:unnamed protein product [Chondrus crispus]CDF37824.1 unnamed protein product [Chondrus crispus]|eukprot:XP_005717695.1 unnamed protein product [Chondrus crispus]